MTQFFFPRFLLIFYSTFSILIYFKVFRQKLFYGNQDFLNYFLVNKEKLYESLMMESFWKVLFSLNLKDNQEELEDFFLEVF
jgi:hypothetical protein